MVKVATYFAMTFGAFLFWQSMDRVHVWIALHQDEKVTLAPALIYLSPLNSSVWHVRSRRCLCVIGPRGC